MPDTTKYKAFISYSHEDSRWARRIHGYLENYRIPGRLVTGERKTGRRLGKMFRDRDELASAPDLNRAAETALEASEFLVVVCSPQSAASRWVNEEVLTFKRLGRDDRILCVIVDGEPNATDMEGRAGEECFCPALRHRLLEDGTLSEERVEPVAADARRQGDGWPLARQKLVAGMLGVGLDDLRQRELQRRNRRLAIITTASLAGMAITLILAITAYNARNDAERRRDHAEGLISFMLGDLRERLNEVGRLDVLDSVAEQAMAYFAELPPRDLDDHALMQRSEALMQLGQVQMARGDPNAAMGPFSEALVALQELAGRDPADLERQFSLGQAHFWVGYVHWDNADFAQATVGMGHYNQISERLYHADPGNTDYLLELGYSVNNLAILANRQGDTASALDFSDQSVKYSEEALNRDPTNIAYRLALAEAYSWNGSLLLANFRLQASENRFMEYLALARDAAQSDPDDSRWLDHYMLANRFAGDAAINLGNTEQAEQLYREGISMAERLLAIEKGNNHWQIEHAILLRKLAAAVLYLGDEEGAIALLKRLEDIAAENQARRPNDLSWVATMAEAGAVKAEAHRRKGEDEIAASVLGSSLAEVEPIAAQHPENEMLQLALAYCLLSTGRIDEVASLYESGLIQPRTPEKLGVRVLTSLQLEGTASASGDLDRLRSSAYRDPGFMTRLAALDVKY